MTALPQPLTTVAERVSGVERGWAGRYDDRPDSLRAVGLARLAAAIAAASHGLIPPMAPPFDSVGEVARWWLMSPLTGKRICAGLPEQTPNVVRSSTPRHGWCR